MNVYCVMRDEARTDLDHIVYATTNKYDAERFAYKNNFIIYDGINYNGKPNIEVLDVIESEDKE